MNKNQLFIIGGVLILLLSFFLWIFTTESKVNEVITPEDVLAVDAESYNQMALYYQNKDYLELYKTVNTVLGTVSSPNVLEVQGLETIMKGFLDKGYYQLGEKLLSEVVDNDKRKSLLIIMMNDAMQKYNLERFKVYYLLYQKLPIKHDIRFVLMYETMIEGKSLREFYSIYSTKSSKFENANILESISKLIDVKSFKNSSIILDRSILELFTIDNDINWSDYEADDYYGRYIAISSTIISNNYCYLSDTEYEYVDSPILKEYQFMEVLYAHKCRGTYSEVVNSDIFLNHKWEDASLESLYRYYNAIFYLDNGMIDKFSQEYKKINSLNISKELISYIYSGIAVKLADIDLKTESIDTVRIAYDAGSRGRVLLAGASVAYKLSNASLYEFYLKESIKVVPENASDFVETVSLIEKSNDKNTLLQVYLDNLEGTEYSEVLSSYISNSLDYNMLDENTSVYISNMFAE